MNEIIKNNVLIAQYMGWKIDNSFPDKNKIWRSPNNIIELDSTMKFRSSWDWLIPVVQKVESEIGFISIVDFRIESIYDFVLEYIKNKND